MVRMNLPKWRALLDEPTLDAAAYRSHGWLTCAIGEFIEIETGVKPDTLDNDCIASMCLNDSARRLGRELHEEAGRFRNREAAKEALAKIEALDTVFSDASQQFNKSVFMEHYQK